MVGGINTQASAFMVLALSGFLASSGLVGAQEEAGVTNVAKPPVAWGKGLTPLEVRGLEEPLNPYRMQYGEWDYWFFDHPGEPDADEASEYKYGRLPENWVSQYIKVDGSGYPLPVLVTLYLDLSQVAAGIHPTLRDSRVYHAWGEMPPELSEAYHDAYLRVRAQFIAEIPAWLAENPPLAARIWKDGSVITHGPLGSWNGKGDQVIHESGGIWYLPDPYYLYSPEGKLLRQTAWDDWEQNVFTGPFDHANLLDRLFYSGWADKVFWHSRACGWRGPAIINGYWVFYDSETRERLVIYDLDGTKLPADFDVNARDANKTGRILGGSLKQLGQYQLELRLAEE